MNPNNDPKKNESNIGKDQPASGGDNVPSGFILKLFQMVNGAPDELIRVSLCSDGALFVSWHEAGSCWIPPSWVQDSNLPDLSVALKGGTPSHCTKAPLS